MASIGSPEDLAARIERLFYEKSELQAFFEAAHALSAAYFKTHPEHYAAFQQYVKHYVKDSVHEAPGKVQLFLEMSIR